ncbi:MAG: DUF6465 family protein [Lachnospiraceae bacterium]|nr:DUF6465 family protein [Lachnospiraceae bacterium]
MADTKKVDVKKMAEEAKKATETVKVAAGKAASSVKATAEKAKKQAENAATETKKQAEVVAEETKNATEAAKKTVKKATTKKPAKKKVEMTQSAVLQFGGEDFKIDEIIANAQAAFKAENKRKTITDIKVYIKPEERAAYYVVTSGDSEYAGKINL